jgi:hypothetical protein
MTLIKGTEAYYRFLANFSTIQHIEKCSIDEYAKRKGITIKPAKQRKTYYEPTKDD